MDFFPAAENFYQDDENFQMDNAEFFQAKQAASQPAKMSGSQPGIPPAMKPAPKDEGVIFGLSWTTIIVLLIIIAAIYMWVNRKEGDVMSTIEEQLFGNRFYYF